VLEYTHTRMHEGRHARTHMLAIKQCSRLLQKHTHIHINAHTHTHTHSHICWPTNSAQDFYRKVKLNTIIC